MPRVIIFLFLALLVGLVDKNTGGGVLLGGLICCLITKTKIG